MEGFYDNITLKKSQVNLILQIPSLQSDQTAIEAFFVLQFTIRSPDLAQLTFHLCCNLEQCYSVTQSKGCCSETNEGSRLAL